VIDLFKTKADSLNGASTFSAGTITLQHDLYQADVAVAPSMIDTILTTKVVPMPISECNKGGPAPYADASISLPASRKFASSPQPYVPSSNVKKSPVTTTTSAGTGSATSATGSVPATTTKKNSAPKDGPSALATGLLAMFGFFL